MGDTTDVAGRLLDRARAGDADAFAELTGPLRHELQLHCYRILGSAADAEDMLQETMMAAWRGLDGFEGRASLRTWLHAIATNKCLNHLRASRGGPLPAPQVPLPAPTRSGEPSGAAKIPCSSSNRNGFSGWPTIETSDGAATDLLPASTITLSLCLLITLAWTVSECSKPGTIWPW